MFVKSPGGLARKGPGPMSVFQSVVTPRMAEACPPEVEEQGEVEGGGDGGAAASGELLVSWGGWVVDWSAHSSPHQVKVEVSVDGLPEDQEALQVGGIFCLISFGDLLFFW